MSGRLIDLIKRTVCLSFREKREKQNIERYPNGTISYNEFRTYTFLRDESVGDPNTTYVNTMNLVYMVEKIFSKVNYA